MTVPWASPGSLSNEAVLKTVASYAAGENADAKDSGEMRVQCSPSADPELWQAIMASLDEQNKRRRRQLSRHLSDVSPEVATKLRLHRLEQLRCSPEGVTFFSWGPGDGGDADSMASSGGGGGKGGGGSAACGSPAAPTGDCGLVLPSFGGYPAAVREAVLSQLTNEEMQSDAEEQDGIINGVPGCTPQLVLATLGDGNCLAHSCSLGVWGVHDRDGRLRAAIQATMSHPLAGRQIRARFERQLAATGLSKEDWAAEWEHEMRTFASSSAFLSDVHAFTLANVLRRPLLIYGDQQAAANALAGVYLPTLWPSPQAQCSRQPLALLFGCSHFSLLATVQGEGPASPPLLPLCTRDGPLQLRFLSEAEAAQAGEPSGSGFGGADPSTAGGSSASVARQLSFLRRYVDAERPFNGRLGVRLSEAPRPHVLVSLLSSLYVRQAAEQQQQQEAEQEEGET